MHRPFIGSSIMELEQAFAERQNDVGFLETLAAELDHRQTQRAAKLTQKVQALLTQRVSTTPRTERPTVARAREDERTPSARDGPPAPRDAAPFPPISNNPAEILAAWTALEVLSPPDFDNPEALAGNRTAVARLTPTLPWTRGEKSQPKKRLYYQVVLGAIELPKALHGLTQVFADTRDERPRSKAYASLAVLTLDKEGRPLEDDPATVASLAWGLPVALAGGVDRLAQWSEVETGLNAALAERVKVADHDGKWKSLDQDALDAAFHWLVERLGLPNDLVRCPWFAIRKYVHIASKQPPESLILNSLVLPDLIAARRLAVADQLPQLIERYLGARSPADRRDLLSDRTALAEAVAPERYSVARWPGAGRHPLVLLQQAAVNLARAEAHGADAGGMLAVNGPPGTGKTTLLRDLFAGLIADRAKAMLEFNDPADAFTDSQLVLKSGAEEARLHRLDPRLRGFEMVIASSNNGAVENVSTELPGLNAIAADATTLRYFKPLADALLKREAWGLAAAALGNSSNRYAFRQTFWDDPELGYSAYLATAAGTPVSIDKDGVSRPPRIVLEEDPPRDHHEALVRWGTARQAFTQALSRSEDALRDLGVLRRAATRAPALRSAMSAWEAQVLSRPKFWIRLLQLPSYRRWRTDYQTARETFAAALASAEGLIPADLHAALNQHSARPWNNPVERAAASLRLDETVAEVDAKRRVLGHRFVDAAFFDRDRREVQTSAPWLDDDTQRLRDDVFVAAVGLHRAFINAAARPLHHNLNAMMRVLWTGDLGDTEKNKLLPDLWSSLFLVTPAISTTFASVHRMLGALPPESLGWLLIDEAGQATPQEAVGVLMRVRHAVVVGDPVQIEPVVTLPGPLTGAVHRRFGVDPDQYCAPEASVQTLSDAATPYMAEFIGKRGSRRVGVPLLVHRRCDEPMFSIANAVAYQGLMVQAKVREPSKLIEALGPSRWIDVRGKAIDKWVPEEGEAVLELLRILADRGLAPDLYIVSPFRVVANALAEMVLASGVLRGLVDDPATWCGKRIGTVHTAQGREDRAVIFVLGAPLPQQSGSRAWAGGRPNLLNVAVTRAKEALYVIGSHEAWRTAGVFQDLAKQLEPAQS